MTSGAENRHQFDPTQRIDTNRLKLDSLKFLLLDRWIQSNIVELPSAMLPLKTAYTFYLMYCEKEGVPSIPVQAFNRVLQDSMESQWPSARKRRAARGILYENLTLRAWASDRLDTPKRGGTHPEKPLVCPA